MKNALLTGPAEGDYVSGLVALLGAARLNASYPDVRRIMAHLGALHPAMHRGLYPGLEIDPRSALPTYREWMRVVTDRKLVDPVLAEASGRVPRAPARRDKLAYYESLRRVSPAATGEVRVVLRRRASKQQRACVTVTMDKLDAAGLLIRFTFELTQQGRTAGRLFRIEGDVAVATEALQAIAFQSSILDAELALLRLAAEDGITVDSVVKGTIGPAWMPGCSHGPLGALLAAANAGMVLSFGYEIAGRELSADGDNDPLEDFLTQQLSGPARVEYEQARSGLAYRVFKDRKFVATTPLDVSLQAFCAASGTRNVIRGITVPARTG